MKWDEYKISKSWELLRTRALHRDGHRCRLCGHKTKLEMHHDKYPDVPENDCLENVRILCRDHHQIFHYLNGDVESLSILQIKKICKLQIKNGWNPRHIEV